MKFIFKSTLLILLFLCSQSCKNNKDETTTSADNSKTQSAASFSPSALPPSFNLPDMSGKMVSLESLKGKTVLLNFWATWCVPCVAEMPALQRISKILEAKGFEVVAINVDSKDNKENVEKFLKENAITFKILSDPDLTVSQKFEVTGFPETFFINQKGEFLEFTDPEDGQKKVRIIADKPWDSKVYIDEISKLLNK